MRVAPIIVISLFLFWAQHLQRTEDDLNDGVVFKLAHADDLAESGYGNPKCRIGTQGFDCHVGAGRNAPIVVNWF